MKSNEPAKPVNREPMQEGFAMLRLLAQSQRSIEAGKCKPLKKAFAELTARTKSLP